jgi:hypothetical protein
MVSEAESSFAAQEINASEKAATKTLKIFAIHLTVGVTLIINLQEKVLFYSIIYYNMVYRKIKAQHLLCKPTISSYANQLEINFRRNGGSEAQN